MLYQKAKTFKILYNILIFLIFLQKNQFTLNFILETIKVLVEF